MRAAASARRHPLIALLLLLGLYTLLSLLTFQPQPHDGGDNAGYVTLARSLLERHAYLDLYDPAEPPHTKYPPVFPLLIAAVMAVGVKSWVGFKLIGVVLGAGAVAASFLWLRRRGHAALGVAVAALLAISPGVLSEARWELSDVPFWCFTALAVWAFERLRPDDRARFALALIATLLAYFTRSAGLPLVLAAGGWLLWRRHWRQLLAFALVIGPLALAWWWRARTTGGADYVSEFWLFDPYQPQLGRAGPLDMVQRILENLQSYGALHLPVLLFGRATLFPIVAALLLAGLAVYGWATRLRRARVAELFLPLYLGLILVWPAIWSAERFLLPVLGLLLAYGGDGFVRTVRALRLSVAPAVLAALALALVLNAPVLADHVRAGQECTGLYRAGNRYPCTHPASRELFLMAELAGETLPQGSVVLSRKPRLFFVMSGGLKSRNYPMDPSVDALLATADSAGARYILFDRLGGLAQLYLAPAMLERPAAFCIVETTGPDGTVLFGILPDAASLPSLPARERYVAFESCTPALMDPAPLPAPR
ncbi:MAG TPA: glycosyltransferase family 39 protein [Longimicrobiales bacterium]|nr:glycosyltransferase family 39 protein [Longimicrobiales bacterium]